MKTMSSHALGFVEVRGYLAAVVVADVALKAANVSCAGLQIIKGGLITVLLTGDVGAVKAAVEIGAANAAKLNLLIASHVIARAHNESLEMLTTPARREIEVCVPQEIIEEQEQGASVTSAIENTPQQSGVEVELPVEAQELSGESVSAVIDVAADEEVLPQVTDITTEIHAVAPQAVHQDQPVQKMETEDIAAKKSEPKNRRRSK
jgi:microcompartment protein CcmL/EutN